MEVLRAMTAREVLLRPRKADWFSKRGPIGYFFHISLFLR